MPSTPMPLVNCTAYRSICFWSSLRGRRCQRRTSLTEWPGRISWSQQPGQRLRISTNAECLVSGVYLPDCTGNKTSRDPVALRGQSAKAGTKAAKFSVDIWKTYGTSSTCTHQLAVVCVVVPVGMPARPRLANCIPFHLHVRMLSGCQRSCSVDFGKAVWQHTCNIKPVCKSCE